MLRSCFVDDDLIMEVVPFGFLMSPFEYMAGCSALSGNACITSPELIRCMGATCFRRAIFRGGNRRLREKGKFVGKQMPKERLHAREVQRRCSCIAFQKCTSGLDDRGSGEARLKVSLVGWIGLSVGVIDR